MTQELYGSDEESILASELVKLLQEKISRHGDHKIYLHDSIADENIPFSVVGIGFKGDKFIVAAESMTAGDTEYLFTRKVIRDARDEMSQQAMRISKIIEAINIECPDLDKDEIQFRPTYLHI